MHGTYQLMTIKLNCSMHLGTLHEANPDQHFYCGLVHFFYCCVLHPRNFKWNRVNNNKMYCSFQNHLIPIPWPQKITLFHIIFHSITVPKLNLMNMRVRNYFWLPHYYKNEADELVGIWIRVCLSWISITQPYMAMHGCRVNINNFYSMHFKFIYFQLHGHKKSDIIFHSITTT